MATRSIITLSLIGGKLTALRLDRRNLTQLPLESRSDRIHGAILRRNTTERRVIGVSSRRRHRVELCLILFHFLSITLDLGAYRIHQVGLDFAMTCSIGRSFLNRNEAAG